METESRVNYPIKVDHNFPFFISVICFFLYRLNLLIEKEREYQGIKEEKNEREVSALKEDLTELKAFALLVVKEQQGLSELLEEHRCCVKELSAITDHIKQDLGIAYSCAKKEVKTLHLPLEHHNQVSIFSQNKITMTTPSLLSEVEGTKKKSGWKWKERTRS